MSSSLHPGMMVSAVICTRNRPELIGRAVARVLATTYPRFELLVVDQSTSPATDTALQPFRADPRFRYRHSDSAGLSLAGNIGLANTTGEIVAFTDDDCLVAGDWIERIAQAFGRDARLGALFGRVDPAPEYAEQAGWLPVFPLTASRTLRTPRDAPLTGPMGANMAYRRSVLERIGGFDVQLGPGAPLRSAGDIDALYRTLLCGARVRLAADVRVVHLGYRDYASGAGGRLIRDSLFANGAYYAKHMRSLDATISRRFYQDLRANTASVLANLLRRRRPVGVRRPLMLLYGLLYSLRFPVDCERRLYAGADSGRPHAG